MSSCSYLTDSVQYGRWWSGSKHMLHNLLQQRGSHRFLDKQTQKKNCYFLHRNHCQFYTKPTNNKPQSDFFVDMFDTKCSKTACVATCLSTCNNPWTTTHIFIKSDIGEFHEKLSMFTYNWAKIMATLHRSLNFIFKKPKMCHFLSSTGYSYM
jgi:hypothetical protein